MKEKIPLDTLPLVQEALRDVRSSLGDSGRVLLRYSGTENICRVMVEGLKKHQVDSLAKTIADIVDSELGVGMVE